MTTSAFQDADRLVSTGFSSEQARELVTVIDERTQSSVESKLEQVLDQLAAMNDRLSKLDERMGKLEERMGKLEDRMGKLEERMSVLEQRVTSEGRVQRLVTSVAVAGAAILGALLAVFAR